MNQIETLKDAEINDSIYQIKKIGPFRPSIIFILLTIIGTSFGIFFNFPFKKSIKAVISSQLSQIKNCPLHYDSIALATFPPTLSMNSPHISGQCFGQKGKNIELDKITMALDGISFSPIGIRFKAVIKKSKSIINIYPTIGSSKTTIRIKNGIITKDLYKDFISSELALKGKLNINALGIINNKSHIMKKMDFLIKSTNLMIPPQMISGLQLPALPLKNLLIKGVILNQKKLKLIKLILGNASSPILAQISGNLELNKYKATNSKLNLKGKIKFSKSFINTFGILNLLLSGKKTDATGAYQFKLNGSFARPKFSFY